MVSLWGAIPSDHDFCCIQILNDDINPTMSKLREERSTYLEYQKVNREYEHLSKFCIAFKFVTAQVNV